MTTTTTTTMSSGGRRVTRMQDLLHSIEDTFSIKVNGSRIYDEAETIEKPKPRNLKEPDDDIVGGWW